MTFREQPLLEVKMTQRQFYEKFFKNLFLIVSTTSAVALVAIIIFVFYQGSIPFVSSTSDGVRIIPDGIEEFNVDGIRYVTKELPRGEKFVELDREATEAAIEFTLAGEEVVLNLTLDDNAPNPADRLSVAEFDSGTLEYPEEYVYTAIFPGAIVGLEKKFHLEIPQRPENFFTEFMFETEWRPTYRKLYGIWTMIVGTILTSLGAVAIGVPIGFLVAVFMAEFIPDRLGRIIRMGIDLLAGIPSVVYGFFGLMVVVPMIKEIFDVPSGSSLLAAMLILAIMMLPTVISIAETSLRAVPRSYREGSLALGATKMQTSWRVVFPAARSGVIAGAILGTSRAVGETMAVIMVAGNSVQVPSRITDGVRTLTATIALEMGYAQGRHNRMLFSVGIVLFIMILLLNWGILVMKKRMAEEK